jgi:hypothetical protein
MNNALIETDDEALPKSLDEIELDDLGRRAKAFIDKSDYAKKKSGEYLISAGRCLFAAQQRVKKSGGIFADWLKEHCDVGRARAYELIAVADGTKSLADLRLEKARSMAKSRAKHKEEAVHNVVDSNSAPVSIVQEFNLDDAEAENIAPEVETITAPEVEAVEVPEVEAEGVWSRIKDDFKDVREILLRIDDLAETHTRAANSSAFLQVRKAVDRYEKVLTKAFSGEPEPGDDEPRVEAETKTSKIVIDRRKSKAKAEAEPAPEQKYKELKPQFFAGRPEGQLGSVYKTRESKPEKVAEYRRAIACGDCKIPPIWLLSYKFREKLAALDIPEPAKKVPQHDSHVKAHAFMQKGFALIEAGGANIADLTFKAEKRGLDWHAVNQCFATRRAEVFPPPEMWREDHPMIREQITALDIPSQEGPEPDELEGGMWRGVIPA